VTVSFPDAVMPLFRLEGPTALSAGAGSGKTTAVVELCLRLLSGDALGTPCDPAEIAAITFTEKAAEELTERVRAAVAARVRDAAPGSPEAAEWLARLHGLDRMPVGTIHGFAGHILREHAVEAGLDPEFEVADEMRAAGWLRDAARAAVVAALDAGGPGIRALVAGQGAGGARAGLADLVAALVRARATRGDAGPPAPAPAAVGEEEVARAALHAAADAFLAAREAARTQGARAAVEAVGRAREALRPGDGESPSLARLSALGDAVGGHRLGKGDGELPALRDALREAAEAHAAAAAEVLAGPQKEALCAVVADAEARYAASKRGARAVDFDDLLVAARDLLRRNPALGAELRRRLRAFVVDEYQDVNPVQQQLFDLVAGPGDPPGPVPVAVGDLKQSIYRFRGADVTVFARLLDRLGAGEGRVLALPDNHRSAPALVALVNETFARALQPPAGAGPRADELRFGERDRLVARRTGGLAPACELLEDGAGGRAAERRAREAAALAARIGALVSGAAGVAVRERAADGAERPRRPRHGDVAILFRRLTQVSAYERALRAAGVPCRLARGGGFHQAPEVRDLGELLATLSDPGDAVAWAAVLRSPLCALSDAALLAVARAGLRRVPWLAAEAAVPAGVPPAERLRLARFLETWRALREVRDRLPPDALLLRAIRALDLDAAHLAAPDGERRLANLEKAVALAARFGRDGGTAAELAAHLRAMAARPAREPEAELEAADAVALLSVHQAKGLEWPIVLVPDLGAAAPQDRARATLDAEGRVCVALFEPASERFVPTAALAAAREADRRAAEAESRRLLYVAMTRARDYLVLSGDAPARGDGGWRALVEAAAAARPDLVRRVPLADAAIASAGGPVEEAASPAPAAPPAIAPPALAPGARPAPIRVAVTDLAEYARCPRRHWLGRALGLPEPRGDARADAGDDPARATARGTLAHALLAEADLAAPPLERRAQLAAAAARRGYDPAAPAVRRIAAEVSRFADSDAGRALAAAARAGRLAREVPFLLRLDGTGDAPACYLVGAIDALVSDRRGALTVVDYKYAMPRPGAVERYRLQLLAYALAAARAHPGAAVRARLQFLRGDHRAVDLTPPPEELARFAADAPRLAWAAFRGDGDRPPAALGRDEARCRAEGCGYAARCHPRSPAAEPGGNAAPPRAAAAPQA
jgi:ATP-dependent exoDNAse (exonuclease V) beta subunit